LSFLPSATQLDSLALPSLKGPHRLAGVDLQKAPMRHVAEALLTLAAQPKGFSAQELAARVRSQQGPALAHYAARKAPYDLRKLRAKALVVKIPKTRRSRVRRPGIRTLAALLVLREKVLKPILAGLVCPKRGRAPKNLHPLDLHYQNLQREMLSTLQDLKLAA
jgi:hypothetical protein